jgi:hypothetical protein
VSGVSGGEEVELPCGTVTPVRVFDLGMREYPCRCGATHAVVMDVHPPERFLPPFLVEILEETIEPTSEAMPTFGTPHLMGLVIEEFPEAVATADVSDDGQIGAGIIWVTSFAARRLHIIIIELIVEVMDHAVSHAEDPELIASFEAEMGAFDVHEFVDIYREERELTAEGVEEG